MSFDFRAAGPGDDAFVQGLLRETITLELGASDWPEPLRNQIVPMQVQARYSSARSAYPQGEGLILRLDGKDAGWLYFARLPSEVRLVEVVVASRVRGKGVGTSAIRHVIESAHNSTVTLHVRVINTGAIRLYERLGFVRAGGDEVNLLMQRAADASC